MSVVDAVAPSRFAEWVDRRRVAVVFLGDGPSTPRSGEVVRGFDLALGEAVAVGWVSRAATSDLTWWSQQWRTGLGPCDPKAIPAAGVWLFVDGLVAAYHPFPTSLSAANAWWSVRTHVLEKARFKLMANDEPFATSGPRSDAPPPEAPRKAAPPPGGPYALLEVDPGCTDAEARSAFLTAIKLNHPDRVAHLSVALQDFARERTQLILTAWATIKKERGVR